MKKFFSIIFGALNSKIWFIVTCSVMVLMILVTSLATTVFYSLISIPFGAERRITDASGEAKRYVADFSTKDEARENGERVNESICEDGFVLLKNQNDTLPLQTTAQSKMKVSVFGKNSVSLVTGGSGSGAGSGKYEKDIFTSLEAANFEVNPTLKDFYKSNDSGTGRTPNPKMENDGNTVLYTGETAQSQYTDSVVRSYDEYSGAALVVFSRIGGEGWDLPRSMQNTNGTKVDGARDANDHYLQLDQNETDLINAVCAKFDKVVILINSATPLELGFLDDPAHYAYNANIDAAMWIGSPGDTGILALGRILNGTVNPSGRLPDIYARNFKNDPTYANFSTNGGGNRYTGTSGSSSLVRAFVDYEEGIYIGYRYYETKSFIEKSKNAGSTWYKDNVVFPFGYGKSYTAFTQSIVNKDALNNKALNPAQKFTVNVNVTNTGSKAGKDAVQIYVTAPYTSGGIEKSYVTLVGFGKTNLIQPGQSETVNVEIDPYLFASYDFDGKNSSAYKGYVLEAGAYQFKLLNNSHEDSMFDSFTLSLASAHQFKKDAKTSTDVVNRFGDAAEELGQKLSRGDSFATMPASRTAAEKVIRQAVNDRINSFDTNNPFTTNVMPQQDVKGSLKLEDMVDKSYDDPDWENLINQISNDNMISLISEGAFKTIAISSIGKPKTTDADGPGGFVVFMGVSTVYGTSHYACQPLMAATYDIDLLFKLGEAVGNEGLIGNANGDGAPYSGWYAPGINIHRSPFGGRVGEYFSEDPLLSGFLASYEIKGAMSKGVYTQLKHFAVNEQETDRAGVCTWLTEQTLREIYLRPFEIAVKVGGTTGMMSSFNRIGAMWTGGDYRLLTEVLRNEWGFRGMVICDFNTGGHMNARQMHYAGGDLNLQTALQDWKPRKSNATDMTILRQNVHNILYTVAGSNAMNDKILGYKLPVWVIVLIWIDVAIFVGLAVWGVFAIRSALKKSKGNA